MHLMANVIFKKFSSISMLLTALTFSSFVNAAPAVIDQPEYKLIVLRSIDQWTPDRGALEDALDSYISKEYKFSIVNESGKEELLRTSIFSSSVTGKSPAMMSAYNAAEQAGWKTSMNPKFNFRVGAPVSIDGLTASNAIKTQSEAYRAIVIKMGSPDELQDAYFGKKVLGNLLAIGASALSLDKYGGTFASNAIIGSGFAGDLAALPTALSRNLPLAYPIQNEDFKSYKVVDFRSVQGLPSGGVGQIIIAYKGIKSPEIESAALSKALESLIGLDTSAQNIEVARAEDFERRKVIWKSCMADPICKDQATRN